MYTTTIIINNPDSYVKSPQLLKEDVLTKLCTEAEVKSGSRPDKSDINIISGFPELIDGELLPFQVEWEIVAKE
ncbi:hypothetical protein [Adhaeribacter pallidiroseus]|uniref:Uncharacterized protein n=1 Tax=Adhaeribacter pallidiroseus TaxID=2072847 RepID=A0A369QE04_9BACT|nr:hypothetical protein [Adhaeribacter pallidiroseus]RDC63141.1 hypothetical protein AHMF7616_01741 [Adhaeribacter pallidiroseus]